MDRDTYDSLHLPVGSPCKTWSYRICFYCDSDFIVRVMVSVLVFPVVNHRFKPQSGQIKTIDLVFAASPLSTLL